MRLSRSSQPRLLLCAVASAALIAACGGSGTPPTTSVSGAVVKGPVANADVCAYRLLSTGKGDRITCVKSDSNGNYTMDLSYQGEVVIEASGGSYTDEATNATKTLDDPMQVVINAQGESVAGMVTPLTSVAYSIATRGAGGLSSTSFANAASSVATQFQLPNVNITTTLPVVAGDINGYGRMLHAVSQLTLNGVSLANFLDFSDLEALQTAFAAAYATINGDTISFTFVGAGAGAGTGSGGGGESCGITVSGSGTVMTQGMTVPFTLPPTKICVTGLPANACAAGNSQVESIAAAGAAPSGDSSYSLNYTYAYAPGDCSGALVTVAYQP